MKRILAALTAAVLMLTVFTACSKSKDGGSGVDLDELMKSINSDYEISDMRILQDKNEVHRYYQVDEDDIKQFAAEVPTASAGYNEIVMIEATDGDAADRITSALEEHLRRQQIDAKRYHADQLSMLESCEVSQSGNYVYLVIGDKYDEIASTISEKLK